MALRANECGEGLGFATLTPRNHFVISFCNTRIPAPCAWKALQLVTVDATHGYEHAYPYDIPRTAPGRRTIPPTE